MKCYVAVTDNDWFEFLRDQPELDEVNFWQPSGHRRFRVLHPGQPLLFKLHSPQNFIVGGGFFAHASLLPHHMAWAFFEGKNGAPSLEVMEKRIRKYRRSIDPVERDLQIGCILLSSPFFFTDRDWIPVPADWSANIVQGKGYDLAHGVGAELWAEVQLRLFGSELRERPPADSPGLYGEPIPIRPRLGQGTFRALVTDTYQRRCAVTEERALPVLDAAHIQPVQYGGRHLIENGLLLRSDVHRLYDAGYVTVTPDYRVRVSRRLKTEFDNGEPYFPLAGREIWLPEDPLERPSRDFLEWHSDVVFRG